MVMRRTWLAAVVVGWRWVGVGLALGWRRLVGASSDCWRGRVRPPRQEATLLRSSCSPIVAPHRYWFNVHRGESTYDLPTAAGVAAGRLVGAGVLVDRRHVSWPFNRHFPTPFPNALSQRSAGSPTRDRSTPSILSAARHSGHLRAHDERGLRQPHPHRSAKQNPCTLLRPEHDPLDTAARSFEIRVRPRTHFDARACHIF